MVISIGKDISRFNCPGIWIFQEEESWWCIEDRSDMWNPIPIADVYLDLNFAVKVARLYNKNL